MNADLVKEQVDCRELVERDLGAPKHRSANYSMYKCPLHHEVKGYSFAVYADHWTCYGACQKSGDAIAWLTEYHGMTFAEAVQALGGSLDKVRRRPPAAPPVEPAEPPAASWQQAALNLVERAQAYLWSEKGAAALAYLRQQRGLHTRYIHEFKLGYIPGERGKPYKVDSVGWVYPGWTIPWFIGGQLWAVNVRRENAPSETEDDGKGKYLLFSGSRRSGALFNADSLPCRDGESRPVLFVEGEFDAIIGAQCADDWLSVVTLGSASGRLHRDWYNRLLYASDILIALDSDSSGQAARDVLQRHSFSMRAVRLPAGKDLTDFYLSFKSDNVGHVIEWLSQITRDNQRGEICHS